jgi:hypothetical protein
MSYWRHAARLAGRVKLAEIAASPKARRAIKDLDALAMAE